ncbi:MAG: hypothetical protein JO165_00100 [Candidatus Eremiobacteraeota bacterium]|nr:hypothetical protein [Candidatus Eremiobacteraeota bacterium]
MKFFSLNRIAAVSITAALLAACGGGARSTTTDKVGTTSVATAPAMPEGNPVAARSGEMQPENGTPAQPIPANLSCAADQIVWVNTAKHVYHYSNDEYYGRTKHGTYMCLRDAQREHDHAAGSRAGGSTTKHHRRHESMESPLPEAT